MATQFPIRDPETGALQYVDHYSLTETARRFHTSREFIRRGVEAGRFPCLTVGGPERPRLWFSDDHLAALYAALVVNDDSPCPPPARLGVVVEDPDVALRGVR